MGLFQGLEGGMIEVPSSIAANFCAWVLRGVVRKSCHPLLTGSEGSSWIGLRIRIDCRALSSPTS